MKIRRLAIYSMVVLSMLLLGSDRPPLSFTQRIARHIERDTNASFDIPVSRSRRARSRFIRSQLDRLKQNVADIEYAVTHGSRSDAMEDHLVDTAAVIYTMWMINGVHPKKGDGVEQ